MKLYTQIEQIFRYRLLSNKDIPLYLKRMTNMGKVDDVKKAELFALILNRLGEIEDEQANLPLENVLEVPPTPTENPLKSAFLATSTPSEVGIYACPDCDMVAKSALGLQSHSRKHKKPVDVV
jgi:hypothetical protein